MEAQTEPRTEAPMPTTRERPPGAPSFLAEAFEASHTPCVLADHGGSIVGFNQAFLELFRTYEDAFLETLGEDSNPDRAMGRTLDIYLEGLGYRRALRKSDVHRAEVELGPLKLEVLVTKLSPSEAGPAGFLLEWFEPEGAKPTDAGEAMEVAAIARVARELGAARTAEGAVRAALQAVKETFGWAYGSYWILDLAARELRFSADVGRVNEAFHAVTASARFQEGVGLSGRAWRARELVFIRDLGELTDCSRREAAQRAGVRSGICFPIFRNGEVRGTMDFFTLEALEPSPVRLEALRTVGHLVSAALEQLDAMEAQARLADEARAYRSAYACSSNPTMLVDRDMVITSMNPAMKRMMEAQESALRASIPGFSVDGLIGRNIDHFHRNPAHQRRILSDRRSFPYSTRVKIGELTFELVVNLLEREDGETLGLVAEWRDLSAEVKAQGEIERLLRAATEGRISERLDCEGWDGFTRLVGEGMNDLLDAVGAPLEETKRVIQALSGGDLTQAASDALRGEFAEVADSLNESIQNLRQVMSRIVESGARIGQAASELADGNAHLNGRTQQQAAALEETAATVEELTGTVKQNAENAQEANKLATGTRGLAERGGEVVGRAVSAMGEINRASKKISDIIGVIDEIAFQTNLLALNAAVEAARAGEQGRGFAVVATEVRNLAQRSAAAAKEIKALIKDSVEKVEEGSKLVDGSGQTLGEIVHAVKRVSEIIAEIAAASEEQASGIEQVNKAVAQMDEMTQQNAAMVEQAASASASMHEQATALTELVGRFNLGDERPAPAAPAPRPVTAAKSEPPPPKKALGAPKKALAAPQRGRTPLEKDVVPPKRTPPSSAPPAATDDWDEF